MPMINLDDRHPGTVHLGRLLTTNPNLPPHLGDVARCCEDVAAVLIEALPDGPELTTGLRKLLEAKDCFVRAAL